MTVRLYFVLLLPVLISNLFAAELKIRNRYGQSCRGTCGGLPVLVLRGTDQERGEAHGYLCAAEIGTLLSGYVEPAAQQAAAQSRLTLVQFRSRALKTFYCPPGYRAELEGVVLGLTRAAQEGNTPLPKLAGSPVTADDMLFANALPDWHGIHCSSYAVWDDSRCLVGRNLDYAVTPALLRGQCVMAIVPAEKDRRATLGIGIMGLIGTLTAMNEAGVTLAIHNSGENARDHASHQPRPFLLRTLLEQVEPGRAQAQAEALLQDSPPAVGANVLLVDPAGTPPGAVIEWDARYGATHCTTLRLPAGKDRFIVTTNHFIERSNQDRSCRRYDALLTALRKRTLPWVPTADEAWAVLYGAHAGGSTVLSTLIYPRERRWSPVFSRSSSVGTSGSAHLSFTWDDILGKEPGTGVQ